MSDPFADIRPYRDEEVIPVLQRLLQNREFLGAIARLKFERATRVVPFLLRPLVRFFLKGELREVADVRSMQVVIKRYMDRMIEDSASGFSASGLADLAAD